MNALLTAIVTWLSVNFGLPAIYDHPDVVVTSEAHITRLRYGTDQVSDGRTVVAIYNDKTHSIMLTNAWAGQTPAELSILVHEMVHHLQKKAGSTYACTGEREALAYAAQAKWLGQFGTDLNREFSIDPMALKIATSCMLP